MKTFISTLIFCFALSVQGQINNSPDTSKADSVLYLCLDSADNQNTQGTVQCYLKAMDAWDKQMNINYKLLMKTLGNSEKSKLKSTQKKWLEYRNSEMELSANIYGKGGGTFGTLLHAKRMYEIVKKRAVELSDYYLYKTQP